MVTFVTSFSQASAYTLKTDLGGVQADLLIRRIYYTKECFAAEGQTVTPGVIEPEKVTDQRLTDCLNTHHLVKAELLNEKTQAVNNPSFDDQRVFCEIKKEPCLFSQVQYVLLKKEGRDVPDILRMSVVVVGE